MLAGDIEDRGDMTAEWVHFLEGQVVYFYFIAIKSKLWYIRYSNSGIFVADALDFNPAKLQFRHGAFILGYWLNFDLSLIDPQISSTGTNHLGSSWNTIGVRKPRS